MIKNYDFNINFNIVVENNEDMLQVVVSFDDIELYNIIEDVVIVEDWLYRFDMSNIMSDSFIINELNDVQSCIDAYYHEMSLVDDCYDYYL